MKNQDKRIFSFDLFSRTDVGDIVADIRDLTNSVFEAFLTQPRLPCYIFRPEISCRITGTEDRLRSYRYGKIMES